MIHILCYSRNAFTKLLRGGCPLVQQSCDRLSFPCAGPRTAVQAQQSQVQLRFSVAVFIGFPSLGIPFNELIQRNLTWDKFKVRSGLERGSELGSMSVVHTWMELGIETLKCW